MIFQRFLKMSKNIKIMPTGFHYTFEYKENKTRTPLDLINEYKIKRKLSNVLNYVKEKADEYLKDYLLELCKKYNYKKPKLILVMTFTLNNNILEKVLIRVMTERNNNIPNGYFCGNNRLLEFTLTQNDYDLRTLDKSSLIDAVLKNFMKKDISIKILLESMYTGKKYNNFFTNPISKCLFIIDKNLYANYNKKLINCCNKSIQKHYPILNNVLFKLVKNGLLYDDKKYAIKICYYQSLSDNAIWELWTIIDNKINSNEKWSKKYPVKNDVKDICKALSDCKTVDSIIQEHDILSMSATDLKELIIYSKTILY